MPFGSWEAKDEKDDLDAEIQHKLRRGYPQDNILFEDSREVVLLQNGQVTMRAPVDDVARLEFLLGLFFKYERPEISQFRKAVEQFTTDLPAVLAALRAMIEKEAAGNVAFRKAAARFLTHAQETINLKREFPRIPFYPDFRQGAAWGKELMELHIGYESVEAHLLQRIEAKPGGDQPRPNASKEPRTAVGDGFIPSEPAPRAMLKADKENGCILLDSRTTLAGIPPEAWTYKLGNRSALEWILDQYKEKKPKDPTIREKFNTYRFADYKEKVIDLLARVTSVSVRTQQIVEAMKTTAR
jgi:hypothetical protein